MESTYKSVILTPADFADTGQWRLIIHVSSGGMGAVLRHVADESRPAVQLFDDKWEPCRGKALLEKIENAVYDHPSLLDDYATEIVVDCDRLTWVPTVLSDEEAMSDPTFASMFNPDGEKAEIMLDIIGEETAVYSFTPGFDGFMARTIPGAKMRCSTSVLVEFLRNLQTPAGLSVFFITDVDYDCMIVFRNGQLIVANTVGKVGNSEADALLAMVEDFWSEKDEMNIYVGGPKRTDELIEYLQKEWEAPVHKLTLPEKVLQSGLPLAAGMLVFRKETEEMLK